MAFSAADDDATSLSHSWAIAFSTGRCHDDLWMMVSDLREIPFT